MLTKALINVTEVVDEGYEGAEILGIHFEGPYLNAKNKGAQPEQFIVTPGMLSSSRNIRKPPRA